MPVRQPTIGESFKRILEGRKRELEERKHKLAGEKEAKLRDWSRKYKQLQQDYERKYDDFEKVRQLSKQVTVIQPLIEKYFVPISDQAAAEKWSTQKVRTKILEAMGNIQKEASATPGIIEAIRTGVLSDRPGDMWKKLAPGRLKDAGGRLKGMGALAISGMVLEEEGALRKELAELEAKRAQLRKEQESKFQAYGSELERISADAESISEGIKGLGALGFAQEKPRVRQTREMRLAAFALRHAGARPMVESQIRKLNAELGRISPLASELEGYRKSVKKIEEKQLEPLFKLLQRHGVLRKEEKQYVGKEFLKDALRKLKDKVPGAELERHYALMSTVSKYAEYQRNIGRLERMMEESGAYGKMQKIQAQLERLENIRRLMLQAKR